MITTLAFNELIMMIPMKVTLPEKWFFPNEVPLLPDLYIPDLYTISLHQPRANNRPNLSHNVHRHDLDRNKK